MPSPNRYLGLPLTKLSVIERAIERLPTPWNDFKVLKKEMQKRFVKGVKDTVVSQIRDGLDRLGIPDAVIAVQLGITVQAVIQWRTKELGMKPETITGLLFHYPLIGQQIYEEGAHKEQGCHGLIGVMYFIRREVCGDVSCEMPLTREEFAWLAYGSINEQRGRLYGQSITQVAKEVEEELASIPLRRQVRNPTAKWLKQLKKSWYVPYMISRYAINVDKP